MENILSNEIDLENNLEIEKKQNNFLQSTLGKTINAGIDLGIRALLPDFLEDQVIDLKNNLINYGLKDGIKKTINNTINLGKSAIGLITGKIENVNQAQEIIRTGGLIDDISSLLNDVIDRVYKNGLINYNTANILKQGKNSILRNVEKNIESTFTNQIKSLNYTEKYLNNWKKYFSNKDFDGMEREYEKIKKEMKVLLPMENVINQAKIIENLHTLIRNNGRNFNLTYQELELAEKLV